MVSPRAGGRRLWPLLTISSGLSRSAAWPGTGTSPRAESRQKRDESGVSFIYAMFHIEDVYDMAGVPAILNPNIAMNKLMNCQVNLTARSICKESEPKNIFSVQRKLLQEDRGAIPLLQAIVVCLKVSSSASVNTTTIPKPSVIRDAPQSFGDLGCQHYLNPLLFARLDVKLKAFLSIPNKMELPYKSILKSVTYGKSQEKSMVQDLGHLDTNNSAQFIYGRPPELGPPCDRDLPRILTSHPATPVYLHRWVIIISHANAFKKRRDSIYKTLTDLTND